MRLFFALPLPDSVRALADRLARSAQPVIPGRYALAENYHLTLAFLGDVPEERVGDAHAVLARCAAAFPAPRVTLTGADVFGRMENGVLILRADSAPDLTALHEALAAALVREGLPVSPGPFAPHVTLARHAAAGKDALWQLTDALLAHPQEARSFTAAQAHVYLSTRDGENVLRYTPLRSAAFL